MKLQTRSGLVFPNTEWLGLSNSLPKRGYWTIKQNHYQTIQGMPRKQSISKRRRTILKPKLKHPRATKPLTTKTKHYIYLMTNGYEYKVGITTNPDRRLKQCQTGNAKTLTYVCIGERSSRESVLFAERSIHNGLRQHRLNGEWFKLNHKLLATVVQEITQSSHSHISQN